MQHELEDVYIAANEPEAYFLKNLLQDARIDSSVIAGAMVGYVGLGESMRPRVRVAAADELRAREIIVAWEASLASQKGGAAMPAWNCPQCGEEVDGDFEMCWNCQHVQE